MTVSIIASVASGAIERSLGTGGSRFANSVSALISGDTDSKKNQSIDVSRISDAISRQVQAAGLRTASLNVAQASSQLATADQGVGQVGRLIGRLQDLASRASADGVSDAERANLTSEFQSVLKEIDRVARETRFQGKTLLDGSLSASDLGLVATDKDGTESGIPDLSTRSLFNGESLSLNNVQNAKAALAKIKTAGTAVGNVQKDIDAFALALEIGAAAVESALYNQDAANSVLTDLDIVSLLLGGSGTTQSNPFAAQIGGLPNDILQLVSE
jgi:flagellin